LSASDENLARLRRKLERESAARTAAEDLLEIRSAELYEISERLREEAVQVKRLSMAIDVSADGIAITNQDGAYTYMNPTHASMFGYAQASECIGMHWSAMYGEDTLRRFERDIFPLFQQNGYWRGEVTGLANDGSKVHQDLSLTALSDGGILCATRDVGIVRRREAQREKLHEMLLDAERRDALGRMANSVAHDFANILAIINASAQLLSDDAQADISDLLIERILQSCSQANDLVEDLMHFDTTPERKVCVLNDLVRDVGELNSNQFLATQGFEVLVVTEKLTCETDPTLFSRMIFNLVKNAREAIEENGTVCLSLEQINADAEAEPDFNPSAIREHGVCRSFPAARLVVRDDGYGMSQKALDTAFLPFQSTKGTGRGLGLVTVDALLQGQPGRMRAYSRPGEGTMIVIDLPLLDACRPKTSQPAASETEPRTSSARGALVIDDDRFQVDLIVAILREFGWDAVGFTNPVTALGVFKVAPWAFELIVTDRRMPQLSGDTLVPELLAIRKDIPIVMSSGALSPPLPAGLAAILAKPVTREKLWATLDRIGKTAPANPPLPAHG
jgi:PAS domain S-box-containing protein